MDHAIATAGRLTGAQAIVALEVIAIVTAPPSEHMVGFIAMVLHTLAFYWMYSRFREQFCGLVCPYARLQSVLLDDNSMAQTLRPHQFVSHPSVVEIPQRIRRRADLVINRIVPAYKLQYGKANPIAIGFVRFGGMVKNPVPSIE